MQFRVPQNIAMEDRIAGPLTAIQFGILVLGGLLSFLVFTSTWLPSPINKLVGGVMGLTTVILSIGKFNDQPMFRFARFIVAFLTRPRIRIWKKGGAQPVLVKASHHKGEENVHRQAKKLTKSEIAGLAAVLDSRGQYGMVPQQPAPPEEKK